MIKTIVIFNDHVEINLFVDESLEEISKDIPAFVRPQPLEQQKTPTETREGAPTQAVCLPCASKLAAPLGLEPRH